MASLFWCPGIAYGATEFWLPPWIEAQFVQQQSITSTPIPLTNSCLITDISRNQGTKIDLTCMDVPDTPNAASVLLWFQNIWSALAGREFNLWTFNDRAWVGCALESMSSRIGIEPLTALRDLKLSIFCPHDEADTSVQRTFTTFASEYPYAAKVGRPGGTASSPGGGITPVGEQTRQQYAGVMPGIVTVTGSGGDHKFIVGGTAGRTFRIKNLQVTGATSAGTGTTTLRAASFAVGGSGSSITATVTSGNLAGALSSSYFDVIAGATVYIACTGANDHNDVQYTFQAEAQ